MDAKPDIVTRAFIAALASYQQYHGQECSYSVDLLPQEEGAAESQDGQQSSSSQASHNSEQHINHQSNERQQPLRHVVAQAAAPGSAAEMQQASTFQGHTQQDGVSVTQHQKQLLTDKPASPRNKGRAAAAGGSSSNGAARQQAAAAAAQPDSWKDAYQEQDSMNNWQQQQQQQPWAHPSLGSAGWDAAAGWGWPGYEQQYGWPPMPPPPPPAPPLPGCFIHPTAGQQQQQACSVCGQDLATAGGQPGTAAAASSRDPAEVVPTLLQQVPSDVAAVPCSLAAAQAAMHKAAAVAQMTDCFNNMPELLMAWFYAGYHAGSLSSSSGTSSSDMQRQQQ